MYERKFTDQTFSRPDRHFQEPWQDYGMNFTSDFVFPSSHQETAPLIPKLETSISTNSVPPEGLVCRWQDEVTG